MVERADAGLAAMRLASGLDAALHEACDGDGSTGSTDDGPCDGAVWTFPDLTGFVSHSTIPGEANITFQFRATSEKALDLIESTARVHCNEDMRARLGLPKLSAAKPVTCDIVQMRDPLPATPMDEEMMQCVGAAARLATATSAEAGTGGVLTMPSRAIHDASPLARVMPAAMLFVQSIDGVSHSFDEHTSDEDLVVGARAYVGAALGILRKQCAEAPPEASS